MAEIHIERRPPSIWPWVLGLLVLAVLVWALVEMFGGREEPVAEEPLAVDTMPVLPAAPQAADSPPAGVPMPDTLGGLADPATVGAGTDVPGP